MERLAYVGFGANLGDPLATFRRAGELLSRHLGTPVKESGCYETKALTLDGAPSQKNYLNAVIVYQTDRSPRDILAILLEVERFLGRHRVHDERWAPRPVDLDLLLVDDLVVRNTGLTLPHPELHKRDFVLRPLCDVAPDLLHPELKVSVSQLEQTLEARGCDRFILGRIA